MRVGVFCAKFFFFLFRPLISANPHRPLSPRTVDWDDITREVLLTTPRPFFVRFPGGTVARYPFARHFALDRSRGSGRIDRSAEDDHVDDG